MAEKYIINEITKRVHKTTISGNVYCGYEPTLPRVASLEEVQACGQYRGYNVCFKCWPNVSDRIEAIQLFWGKK